MARIFVFGDSHTRVLKKASIDYVPSYSSPYFDIHWMLKEKNGKVRGDLRYEDALKIAHEMTENDLLAVSLLGTGHNIFGLIEHEVPLFLLDDIYIDNMLNNRYLIPFNLMYDMFISFCKKNKTLPELKKATKAKVVHLMTPPPKENNHYIKSVITRNSDSEIIDRIINPAEIRLKFWNIEMKAMQSVCENYGIDIVPPPPASITPAGFLSEDYYGSDVTHANAAYGKLVLEQLEKLQLSYAV